MGARILVIQGHPDATHHHLCHALADSYAQRALDAGYEVRRLDIASLDFPLLRSQKDFMEGAPPESLRQAQDSIVWCEHMLLVFPLWLGGAPALVQAFLEQTMRPGFAYRYREKGLPEKLMKGRPARLVVTMGMPALAYRFWFMEHGVKRITQGVLGFVGFSPVRVTYFGMIEQASDAKREDWLQRMRELGRAGG
jgi:putative NADPH-quinone reductase